MTLLDATNNCLAFFCRKAHVHPLVIMGAHFTVEIVHQLRRVFARLYHQVKEIEIGQDTVTLQHMPPEAVAPALLPADERVLLDHFRGDILKAHRRLIYRHLEYLPQTIDHTGSGDGLDYRATLTAHLQHIEAEQGKDLELSQKVPLFVDNAHAVGIAVGSQAHRRPPLPYRRHELGQVNRNWLGADAGEERISFAVYLY